MADLATALANIAAEHDYNGADNFADGSRVEHCICGWPGHSHVTHVAVLQAAYLIEHLIEHAKELGLTEFHCAEPVPERWWATRIQYQDENGNWQ